MDVWTELSPPPTRDPGGDRIGWDRLGLHYDHEQHRIFSGRPPWAMNATVMGVSVAAAGVVSAVTWAARSSLRSLWAAVPVLAMAPAAMALVSAYLLMARGRATGDRRFRVLALAYLVVGLLMVLHLSSYPPAAPGGGPFGFGLDAAAVIFLVWHVLLSSAVLWALGLTPRRRLAIAGALVAVASAAVMSASASSQLIEPGGRFTPAFRWLMAGAALYGVAAALAWARGTAAGTTCAEGWVLLSLAFGSWDPALGALASGRADPLWYASLWMRMAGMVLLAGGLLTGFTALFRAISRSETSLLERLESDLERAKADGRRSAEVDPATAARVAAVIEEGSLPVAFQPIVDLRTRTDVGYEALARFDGEPPLPPDVWFAQAEALGLRTGLEMVAVASALAQIDDLPPGTYLAVNVSAGTASAPEFARLVGAVGPERVVVELTEHERVDDYDALEQALGGLRRAGMRLAVDDAGAGFSSLAHVVRLRPDMIKLDMSLVRGVDRDPTRRALATALIRFANETGATIIAEGVETRSEVETLRSLGAGSGQGFFVAQPGPLPDVAPDRPPRPRRAGAGARGVERPMNPTKAS